MEELDLTYIGDLANAPGQEQVDKDLGKEGFLLGDQKMKGVEGNFYSKDGKD